MKAPETIEPIENYLDTADGKIHYLDWGGSGFQVHLLHANGFCAGTYSPFVKHLIDDLHIVASDIRGHGDSDHPNLKRVYDWHIFADDLKILIEQTMSPPIIGMGHSLGAVTTYTAAAKYPKLFSAIILIDPAILPRRRLWWFAALRLIGLAGNRQLAQAARRRRKTFQGKSEALNRFTSGHGIFKSWSQEFVEAYLECGLLEKDSETAVLKCDPELEAQIFESVPFDVWRYAKKIVCPVLAIRGEHSDVFTADSAGRLKHIITDYELATIPDAGHFAPMGKPQKCARVISEFIHRKLAAPDK
ncbi:MAG: alpha/beta hydrolase [Deltaproteobacteria bacterium]|nr:alpha/beta hydrolase [Deltaproteobacteria bacterium]